MSQVDLDTPEIIKARAKLQSAKAAVRRWKIAVVALQAVSTVAIISAVAMLLH